MASRELIERIEQSNLNFQTALEDRLLVLLGWISIPLAVMLIFRIYVGSLPLYFFGGITLCLMFVPLAIFRESVPHRLKSAMIFLPLVVLIASTLTFQGLYSHGIALFALTIMLAFFVTSTRMSLFLVVSSGICLSLVAWFHFLGFYEAPIELNDFSLSGSRLLTSVILLILFAFLGYFTVQTVSEKNSSFLILQADHEQKISQLAAALEEIKLLREVVNLCSSCQKVRLNPGKESLEPEEWVSLQTFVALTTNTELSHGYCPECFHNAMSGIEE